MKNKKIPAIEIKNLHKTYPDGMVAVKDISLTVQTGEFFGLLGPNGAGKSTTIGILSSLINKSSGHISICGHNLETHRIEAKQCLGIVPQEFNFNIFEPCLQILINQAGYYGIPRKEARKRAENLLKKMELWDRRNTPSRALSGGLKRRLMIARALINNPRILILDEPTAGVDIQLRRSMWKLLTQLNKEGLTIILTTHYLEEAEALCKHIAIINKGKIIAHDRTLKLLENLQTETYILYCNQTDSLPEKTPYAFKKSDENTLEITLKSDQNLSNALVYLKENDIIVLRNKNKTNRLEEIFVNLVEPV